METEKELLWNVLTGTWVVILHSIQIAVANVSLDMDVRDCKALRTSANCSYLREASGIDAHGTLLEEALASSSVHVHRKRSIQQSALHVEGNFVYVLAF